MSALPDATPEGRTVERGPRVLFFSGGSALRPLCRKLKLRTHNSIHIVTPFDSGGSSGPLRRAFGMPAVGDLRNRVLALADEEGDVNERIYRLLSHRLPVDSAPAELRRRLQAMIEGVDPLVAAVEANVRGYARSRLRVFAQQAPGDFDLRGASVGNLVLTGAWLEKPDLSAAVAEFSSLLTVRGTVQATVDANLHLAVTLHDGRTVVGQHRITGKEAPPLAGRIRSVRLVDPARPETEARIEAPEAVRAFIRSADLICFPMGSFFSSVLCNLLPAGIGRAVAEARCPKVYVPNTGRDPEQYGLDAAAATRLLLETLRQDAGPHTEASQLLDYVLLDTEQDAYDRPPDADAIAQLGPRPARAELCGPGDAESREISPARLMETLLALAEGRSLDAALAAGKR